MQHSFVSDLLASIVVFLVALPLCLGIAIASGVSPALGLITGVVGGVVVGFLQGSSVAVSGPAAGLTVIVAGIVAHGGVLLLSAVCLAAGLLQLAGGLLRAGRWFRAVPPALIHGMLAGIGVLIVVSQSHVMLDQRPARHGLENLIRLPGALTAIFGGNARHSQAALVGLLTIGVLLGWKRVAPGRARGVPAPLVAVGLATLATNLAAFPIARVDIPLQVWSATELLTGDALRLLGRWDTWGSAFGLAVVASAETLLCIAAVDRMAGGVRTDYDRELRAQGVGNTLCGLLGALPMTAVIVRSSTNLQAGARTRASTILHGAWLLTLVVLAPTLLGYVPVCSLAAVLVFTGWKLVDRTALADLRRHGGSELLVYTVTLGAVVATDLLIGVGLGLAVAAGMLLYRLAHVQVSVEHDTRSTRTTLRLRGSATFLRLPDIAETLETIPPDRELHVLLDEVHHIDHAVLELLAGWERSHRAPGGRVVVDWEALGRSPTGDRGPVTTNGLAARAP